MIDTRAVRPPSFGQRIRRFFVPRHSWEPTTRRAATLRTRSGSKPARWHALISALILLSAFKTLAAFGRLWRLLPEKQAFMINAAINWRLRTESLRRLRLEPLTVPLVLFRSDDTHFPRTMGGALSVPS
jgi:hypothetical protein